MLECNNYYIQDQKNLTYFFTDTFVIIDDILYLNKKISIWIKITNTNLS
ncbi:hypothetical protein [Romboutsia ilealis]|nr:hypothetical protein [Romboutsia ilealis]